MTQAHDHFADYSLGDRYTKTEGRAFLTGTQALIRIMMDQAGRDQRAGLNTAGFVSGYRGSPLGGLDLELWRVKEKLQAEAITFMPAINEDLGATAVLGAQQASLDPDCEYEGIFSMWYGKGPGLDRSGDALKHGNAYGSSPKGGVLVVAGDDHGCVSSSMPHQSDIAFMSWFMPMLNPASVGEYLEYGEYGLALSRFSGTWVGFKAISETVESGQSVELRPDRMFSLPEFTAPSGGLHVRTADLPSPEIEVRIGRKLKAVETFVEANPIDRFIYNVENAEFGFVSTGKGHLDLMEALRLLGLCENKCRSLGIDIYKVGMVWPLARRDALSFVRGKKEVLVVEEKRGIIESQFKEYFYDWPGDKPDKMVGKFKSTAEPLIPWTGELSPLLLVPIIAERLHRFFPQENLPEKAKTLIGQPPVLFNVEGATRTPYFCSGCPHNTSTRVPKGSRAASGIGCHVMASWMNRDTDGYAQMGGEGVSWIVSSKFNGGKHIFQNLGEGTWYHSGSLAIRQAVAAKTNITYKILYNDAVAMTGGQPVDGPVSVSGIAQTCRAEGVERIALVSDNPKKFNLSDFPHRTTLHDRTELDRVQRELRDIKGVTVIIYEQTCATEKRRRRKRGTLDDPKRFAFINPLVCEGCGDCSLESNCLSVEPLETEFGRKRKINLSSCNKDFSCLNGFCPSFVTIEGADRRRKGGTDIDLPGMLTDLPAPSLPSLDRPFNLLVTGVGGTGVVTVGALITMAAHLEGNGSSVLDFTGFAQKFGTVLSYIRLGPDPHSINQVRIDQSAADAVIGCDIVVSSSAKASAHYRRGTSIVLNHAKMPTGDLVLRPDAALHVKKRVTAISNVVGETNVTGFDANSVSEEFFGNAVYANVLMLGYAWQSGLVPVGEEALKRAIELNGVAVAMNITAFDLGRILAVNPGQVMDTSKNNAEPASGVQLIEQRAAFLVDYQNEAYSNRYLKSLAAFASSLGVTRKDELVEQATRSLFKLMAYKDEYEVARLHTQTGFDALIAENFTGDYKVNYHMAPPLLSLGKDGRGRSVKTSFGPWMTYVLRWMAGMKFLRGTVFDLFHYTADRREEVALIKWFEDVLTKIARQASDENIDIAKSILAAPMAMKGFGPVKQHAVESHKNEAESLIKQLES